MPIVNRADQAMGANPWPKWRLVNYSQRLPKFRLRFNHHANRTLTRNPFPQCHPQLPLRNTWAR